MENHPYFRREQHPHWPHFDNRGPEYYYHDEPGPRRGRDFYDERPYPAYSRYENDSDIYEEEFYPPDERDYRSIQPRNDVWPDDDFSYNRRNLRRPEGFFEEGLHRMRDMWQGFRGRGTMPPGRGEETGRYPEDRYHDHYGRDAYANERRYQTRRPRNYNSY